MTLSDASIDEIVLKEKETDQIAATSSQDFKTFGNPIARPLSKQRSRQSFQTIDEPQIVEDSGRIRNLVVFSSTSTQQMVRGQSPHKIPFKRNSVTE